MKSNLVRLFAGTVVTLSLLGSVSVVQASSLSSTQVSAIISLLQAFGADQGVINNVSATLGGGQTISTLTCASFSDVTYGTFDDAVGGRVSQLQTWLGIPSNTFGFGTYGKKTQALWNSKCSGVVTPSTTTTVSNVPLHAEPLSGAAPLTVLFNTGTTPATSIFFGDGLHADLVDGYCTRGNCSISHTYLASGTYTAIIKDANEKTSGTATIAVTTASVSTTPATTTSQSSLSSGATFTASPSSGAAALAVTFSGKVAFDTFGTSGGNIDFGDTSSSVGRSALGCVWTNRVCIFSTTHTYTAPGTYTARIFVYPNPSSVDGVSVATTNVVVTGSTLVTPTATIDQSSLTTNSGGPTLSGSATNTTVVNISISDTTGSMYASGNLSVSSGRWSVSLNPILTPGTYTVYVHDGHNTVLTTGTLTVTGGSTSGAAPTCTLKTDKQSYTYGDPITLSWTSSNATSASWLQTQKDNIALSTATLPANGSQTTYATVQGIPYETLNVLGAGGSGSCSTQFSIAPPVSSNPSATIDQSSLVQTAGGFSVTGSDANTSTVWVVLVSSSYSGTTDFASVQGLVSGQSQYKAIANMFSNTNGTRWTATFANVSSGSYNVYVYGPSTSGNETLLTSGALVVTGSTN